MQNPEAFSRGLPDFSSLPRQFGYITNIKHIFRFYRDTYGVRY